MLHLWSQMLVGRRRSLARALSVCGGALCCAAFLLIGLSGGNNPKSANAQDLPEAPGTALINPIQVTPVLPQRTAEPQAPTSVPPTESPTEPPVPTTAPSIPAPVPTDAPQPPAQTDTPQPPPAPTDAPQPQPAPPQVPPTEPPTTQPIAPVPPTATQAAPVRTRAPVSTRARPSPTAPPVPRTAIETLTADPPQRSGPATQRAPRATPTAQTGARAATVDSRVATLTTTPQAIAAVPPSAPALDAQPAPIVEAPEAALPPPSLETANVVYASALRRIDARRYAVSACLANIGFGRESGLEINIDVRARGARVVEVRSDRATVSISGARAQIRPEPIDANGVRQVDLVVESDLLLTERDIAVAATQARWLAGRVRIACAPGAAGPNAAVLDRAPRFTLDGATVSPADAAQALRVVAAQPAPAPRMAWVLGSASWAALMLAAGSALLASALALWFVERP
jgi:hypothetical protein